MNWVEILGPNPVIGVHEARPAAGGVGDYAALEIIVAANGIYVLSAGIGIHESEDAYQLYMSVRYDGLTSLIPAAPAPTDDTFQEYGPNAPTPPPATSIISTCRYGRTAATGGMILMTRFYDAGGGSNAIHSYTFDFPMFVRPGGRVYLFTSKHTDRVSLSMTIAEVQR